MVRREILRHPAQRGKCSRSCRRRIIPHASLLPSLLSFFFEGVVSAGGRIGASTGQRCCGHTPTVGKHHTKPTECFPTPPSRAKPARVWERVSVSTTVTTVVTVSFLISVGAQIFVGNMIPGNVCPLSVAGHRDTVKNVYRPVLCLLCDSGGTATRNVRTMRQRARGIAHS